MCGPPEKKAFFLENISARKRVLAVRYMRACLRTRTWAAPRPLLLTLSAPSPPPPPRPPTPDDQHIYVNEFLNYRTEEFVGTWPPASAAAAPASPAPACSSAKAPAAEAAAAATVQAQ